MPKLEEFANNEMVSVHLTFSKNEYLIIQDYAKDNWISASSIIRIAISEYILRKGLDKKRGNKNVR